MWTIDCYSRASHLLIHKTFISLMTLYGSLLWKISPRSLPDHHTICEIASVKICSFRFEVCFSITFLWNANTPMKEKRITSIIIDNYCWLTKDTVLIQTPESYLALVVLIRMIKGRIQVLKYNIMQEEDWSGFIWFNDLRRGIVAQERRKKGSQF